MYQEWDSPSFTAPQLADIVIGFFEARGQRTALEIKRGKRLLVKVHIAQIKETQSITIDSEGKKIRLTYPPLSHVRDGLARVGSLIVTGAAIRSEAQKQQFLDDIEQQFWANLDTQLAELASSNFSGT